MPFDDPDFENRPQEARGLLIKADSKWRSRKLLVAVGAICIVALNRKLGLGLTDADVWAILALAVSYVTGQQVVDVFAGRQLGTSLASGFMRIAPAVFGSISAEKPNATKPSNPLEEPPRA